ncbi:Sensor histidine kinase RcsC [compost metagenome]
MNVIWARSAAILISLVVVAAGVYLASGPVAALALACAVLFGLLCFYLYQINRLWKVLDAPVYGEIPSAVGLWGEVYYRLHRLVKRWRTQVLLVEQQHTRFIQAIQASPNGVLMLDDADQIEWCNDVAEQHFGLNARRDVRQRITHLIRRPEFVHIVEDLLALAKLESDAQPPGNDMVAVQAMVAHLMHDAEALSQGRHRIAAEIDPTVGFRGADTELLSALGNLVSNAVRYTPDGGRISLRLGWEEGHAVFSVADTGLGIAAEHIPRLTERFYRIDRSRSRDTGGTGLGLAIVKHVLSRHHADLRVTSEEGRGSVFRIIFPLERSVRSLSDAAAAVPASPQAPDSSRRAA